MFKRHKTEKTVLRTIQDDIKKRKKIKEEKTVIQNVEETKVNIFILYCVSKGKEFSVPKACEDLGLLPNQVDEMMGEVIEKGYITLELGFPSATLKLKEVMFTSRIQGFKKYLESEKAISNKASLGIEDIEDSYIPINFKLN